MSKSPMTSPSATPAVPEPWWRVGFVWLVVGGPLTVVVAALVTAAIAVSGAEEVLTDVPADVSRTDASALPAVQGRNHAATPRR